MKKIDTAVKELVETHKAEIAGSGEGYLLIQISGSVNTERLIKSMANLGWQFDANGTDEESQLLSFATEEVLKRLDGSHKEIWNVRPFDTGFYFFRSLIFGFILLMVYRSWKLDSPLVLTVLALFIAGIGYMAYQGVRSVFWRLRIGPSGIEVRHLFSSKRVSFSEIKRVRSGGGERGFQSVIISMKGNKVIQTVPLRNEDADQLIRQLKIQIGTT